jgi:hypothetical protein
LKTSCVHLFSPDIGEKCLLEPVLRECTAARLRAFPNLNMTRIASYSFTPKPQLEKHEEWERELRDLQPGHGSEIVGRNTK